MIKKILTIAGFIALLSTAICTSEAQTYPIQNLNLLGQLQLNGSTGTAGQVLTSQGPGLAPLYGTLSLGSLGTIGANTIVGNFSSSSQTPTVYAVSGCSGATSALNYTTNTGVGCNSAINAATLNGATFAAPGAIGSTTPSTGAFTTLTANTPSPGDNSTKAATTAFVGAALAQETVGQNQFRNPQWQIMGNSDVQISQVGPQSLTVLPSFTITGSNTGSAIISFTVTGSPNLNVNDLVALSGSSMNAALKTTPVRVLTTTGSPVTSFTAIAPLANYVPGSSQSGTGQVVTIGDLGSSSAEAAQSWTKATTLQIWPTSYSTDIDPGAIRCLGAYKAGTSTEQAIYQTIYSASQLQALAGQTVTVSFRVKQRVKGGSGTSEAIAIVNGTEIYGTAAPGGGSYEDVRLTTTLPTTLTSLSFGVALSGASADNYYICKPYVGLAAALPANYFSERPNDFYFSRMDIVPNSLNGASFNFPGSTDQTGVYYSLWHDPYAESYGRVHWSITCEQFSWEFKSTSPGAAVAWRNVLGNSGGQDIVYGTAAYTQVSSIMSTVTNRIPTDTGQLTNSIAPGFLIIYTGTAGLAITAGSMDVQGYCLN